MISEHKPVDPKESQMPDEPDVDIKNKARKGEYEIGFGKPPPHTRFKKGESGNPRGRPVGSANAKTRIARVLDGKVAVREGGKTRFISKLEAMFEAQTNKAMKGDPRSFSTVIAHAARIGALAESAAETSIPTAEEDAAIIEDFLRRHARPTEGDPKSDPEKR
jgi:hypothetical protein